MVEEPEQKIVYIDANPTTVCCVAMRGVLHGPAEVHELPRRLTSNEAEYAAVIYAMYKHPDATLIRTDSKLVAEQLNMNWAIHKKPLRELAKQCWQLGICMGIDIEWVPRKENIAGKVLG